MQEGRKEGRKEGKKEDMRDKIAQKKENEEKELGGEFKVKRWTSKRY